MNPARLALPLGVLLLVAAALVLPPGATPATAPVRDGSLALAAPAPAPLALALEPLGPLKAVVSATLWASLLSRQVEGRGEAIAGLAEGLLALHPGLDRVRAFLAQLLIVDEAPRAPDAARHRALVVAGLQILEDGLALTDSPELHGTLGRLLVTQAHDDARFTPVAEQYFGSRVDAIALTELRRSDDPADALHLVDLLVQRGLVSLSRDDDTFAAERDLDEAESILRDLPPELGRPLLEQLQAERKAIREDRS